MIGYLIWCHESWHTEPSTFNAGGDPSNLKSWLIDSGCTSHLSPNWTDFISYTPYDVPQSIQLGNGSSTPSLGEGIISLECLVNGVHITCHFQNVQYIPGLTHGLLSCKVLDQHGLHMRIGDGMCKIIHHDSTVIAESLKDTRCLYYLSTASDSPWFAAPTAALATTTSFNLLHKQLAHPGKDALLLMVRKGLSNGLSNVTNDAKNFDCIACIQGKMVQGSFQVGHEVATKHLGHLHSDICGLMDVPPLGKNHYFCILVDDKTHYLWFHPCTKKSNLHLGLSDLTPSLPTTINLIPRFYALTMEVSMSMPPSKPTVLRMGYQWSSPSHTPLNRMESLSIWTGGF